MCAGLKKLNRSLTPEINEYYLLHGTKAEYVELIMNHGFDFRQANDELLFGRGIYFAECSTKSDQHTGEYCKSIRQGCVTVIQHVQMCVVLIKSSPIFCLMYRLYGTIG
jgi:hypothetical protein